MITKAQVKHIRSLDDKKYRNECKEFVVEGEKMVDELLNSSMTIICIYATKNWVAKNANKKKQIERIEIEESELARISMLSTPNQVLTIVKLPMYDIEKPSKISLVLDKIQDPGNLGSIVRIADWFDVSTIYCSHDTVDVFNSKVVQSSMGSVFRVKVIYCDLNKLLTENKAIPSYVAILKGNDISTVEKITEGFIIIGNESKGVSEELIALSSHKISIQRKGQAESLNAAVATGIICHSLLS